MDIKIGDILVSTYGYNCRLVNFYKVVGITKTGKSVRLMEVGQKVVSHDGYGQAGFVLPDAEGPGLTDAITKKIHENDWKGYYVKISDYKYAYPWDGKQVAFDTYD